jgi:molybdenum cofactor guanylyltransferase
MKSELCIAIMAGGLSRRFGMDKAMLSVGGVPMLERMVRTAMATGLRTTVIGRTRSDGWPHDNVEFLEDETAGLGPMCGIATALRRTGGDVLALACDMPLVTVDALHWLLEQADHDAAKLGVVTVTPEGIEPLFSLYRLSALPLADGLLAKRRLAMRKLLSQDGFHHVAAPDSVRACLRNINSPDDLSGL